MPKPKQEQCGAAVWDARLTDPNGWRGWYRQCMHPARDYRQIENGYTEIPVCRAHLRATKITAYTLKQAR